MSIHSLEYSDPMLDRRVGPYRLTQHIGEGGMGVVYLAEREDEFHRRVAIKLVRYAMAYPEVVARLRTERQTLAALSHPNIVRLLDGGTTDDGLPYLAMEYVEGTPIDEYCAQRTLDVPARLRLFLEVCAAVQCAHQSLVVHCDLKPSNILVTAGGVPKLLDFGIAKLLTPDAAEGGLTIAGHRPFTPRFASPEQALGRPVTTATDVYALGAILYHLLTGHSPYRIQTHSEAEMISAVCTQEPQRPSAGAPDALAARRLAGDLDAILLQALRKEPESRYSSAEQLAADVRCHLEGRPVGARKGTFRYRTAKFILRNRALAAAAAVAALALFGGTAGIAWQARAALKAGERAERRFNDVRELAHFMLFDFHDAVQKLPGSTPVQEMLVSRSLKYLDSLAPREAGGDANLETELVQAYVRLGDVQGNPYNQNLGDADGALASYKKAQAIAEPLVRSAPGNLRAVRALAQVHAHTADALLVKGLVREAAAHGKHAAATFEKLAAAQPHDVAARVDLAASLDGLGDQLGKGLGDRTGALESYRKSLRNWETVLALDSAHIRARRAVAGMSMKIADIETATDARAALARLEKASGILATLPEGERSAVPAQRLAASILRRIADCQWELDDVKASLATYGKATEAVAALAALDPANARAQFDLVVVLNNGGEAMESSGDLAGALRNYGQVADTLERLLKTDAGNMAWRANLAEILVRIGGLLGKTGQHTEARRQTARGLEAARRLAEERDAPAGELVRAARLFVLCQPRGFRDFRTAGRYAQRAVDLTKSGDAYALDTLAEAQLGSGDRTGGEQTIRKALALTGPLEAAPWIRRALERKLAQLR